MRRAGVALVVLLGCAAARADGTVVTAEQADRVATHRTYQDLAQQVAGVVDVDGGGNPQIQGGTLTMNRYFLDGLDVTDPVTHTFGANVPFASLDLVEVLTGGMEAQYDALGGVINLVTSAGSDRLHLDASVFVATTALWHGPPLDDVVRPFAILQAPATPDYQANLVVSGPLVKRRLWLDVALEYDHGERGSRRFDAFLGRAKLTWAPSDRQRVTVSASAAHQRQDDVSALARWEYVRSGHVKSDVALGVLYDGLDGGPDLRRDRRWAVHFDPSLSLRGSWFGTHEAKIGLQSRFVDHAYRFERPGGSVYLDADGELAPCDEATGAGCFRREDAGPFANQQWGVGAGLYLQDRWKPWKRITILPGIRFDWGLTRNSVGQTVTNLFGIGPRLGAIWDVGGDGRTLFRLFYGRANETLSLLPAANADVSATFTTQQWNPATNQFERLVSAGGAGGYQIDPHAATPHADEITLGLRRALFGGAIASVDYTYKRIANIWDGVEVNQIWNPAGTNVVGYADGTAQQRFRYTTPDGNYRIYHGLDFVLAARPSPHLDFYAAYTLSWLYGPGGEELGEVSGSEAGHSPFYNPRQSIFFDGFLPEDVRHAFKLRASYDWRGLVVGAILRYQSGAPFARLFYSPYDGGYTLRRTPEDALRLPDTVEVDLRAAYDFHALLTRDGRHHLQLIADLFNLFDLGAPVAIEARDLPTFGTVTRRQEPFRFQIGLRYTY